MKTQSKEESTCCPRFDPAPCDDKIVNWENKKFIKDKVCTLFYMPVNFGSVMKRLSKTIEKAGGQMSDYLCLSDHTSMWNMDLFMAVDKEIPGASNVTISGNYFCKVYEGDFRETGKWCKDYENILNSKGYNGKKLYMWYTTCPKCAKKYGKNYVVILSSIE